MHERPIPGTGEMLPVIGLGTWQSFDVGGGAERAPLREVLGLLAQGGGKLVDSSPMYGASESVAGDVVHDLRLRDKLFIATKVWTSGRAEGERQMETSRKRLRVERLDLMQIHNLVDAATHTRTLQAMKAQGKVRYIGITHYTASAYAEVERWVRTGQYDFLQINYSLGEREAEQRILGLAQDNRLAVIVNRPFALGALHRAVKGKPLPPVAAEIGAASCGQYFLKWILGHPAVTCVIPATARPEHMQDNVAAGAGPLPDDATRKRMVADFAAL